MQPYIFLLLCCSLFYTTQAQSDIEIVKQADDTLNQLILMHRSSEAEKYYADDFILTTSSGKVKLKTDMVNEIGLTELSMEINQTDNVNVRILNTTAVLTGTLHQKGTYKGKSFDVFILVTDTWVKTDDGWRILAGHASVILKP
jgi:hypothetical protein